MLKIFFENDFLTVTKLSSGRKVKSVNTIFFDIACEIDNDNTEKFYRISNINADEIKAFVDDVINTYCTQSEKIKNKIITAYCDDKEKQQKVIDLLNSFIVAQKLIGGKK